MKSNMTKYKALSYTNNRKARTDSSYNDDIVFAIKHNNFFLYEINFGFDSLDSLGQVQDLILLGLMARQ